ncbi:hypothetical protein NBRC116592_23770 [Colwellia sp. KU-HH00111]
MFIQYKNQMKLSWVAYLITYLIILRPKHSLSEDFIYKRNIDDKKELRDDIAQLN